MDLGIFSYTNYTFSTVAAAKAACLNDIVNFLTNASYDQSQNTFFNTTGNAIYRSSNCFDGWSVHDAAAGTNQKVIKCPYPTAMGAGKFCYVRISTNGSAANMGENGTANTFVLVFDVFEAWNATTHVGTNGAGISNNWSEHYGFAFYPANTSYQQFVLAASKYVIYANRKGVYGDSNRWGFGNFYSSGTISSVNSFAHAPMIVGIMPYAEGTGWHTAASNYPAIFATYTQSRAHPFGTMAISRYKQANGIDASGTANADCALDLSVTSTSNSPAGVPTTSIPNGTATAGNMLAPIVPYMPTLGARFQNADFSFSESLADGLFMACSGTGAAFDTILSSAGKSHILFPCGSTSGGNNCLMFAIRIN